MPTTSRLSSEAIKKSRPLVPFRVSEIRGRSARKIKWFPRFVIHEHNASHLHWDFRLELDGVLKSWALPKQPPKRKNLKRLAVQVEDHSLEYGKFEGEITEGYGKGTVKIWDKGIYKLIKKDKSKIEFELKGKKLTGTYVLVNAKLGGKDKNWLFFRIE